MKTKIQAAALLLYVMFNTSPANCENDENGSKSTPFGKGTWLFNLNKPIRIDSYTEKYEISSAKYSDYRINLESNYFFHDNMGIGLGLNMSRSVSDNSYKQINNSFTISGSYLQGFKLGGINMLTQFTVGIGKEKNINKSTDIDESTGLFRLKLEEGPVLKLFDRQPFLFHPYIGIMYERNNYKNYKEDITNFFVKADLIFNLSCTESICDCENDFEDAHLRFAKGIDMFSASTMGDIKFGGLTRKYDETDYKYGTNRQAINLNYRHYIFDGLSVGAWTSFSRDHQKEKDNGSQNYSTNTDIIIGPGITYHPPLGKYYENIFLDLNAGIGVNSSKAYDESDHKENIIGGFFDVGYDYGITKNISICPAIGWELYRYKNPDNNTHYNENGFVFTLGMNTTF